MIRQTRREREAKETRICGNRLRFFGDMGHSEHNTKNFVTEMQRAVAVRPTIGSTQLAGSAPFGQQVTR